MKEISSPTIDAIEESMGEANWQRSELELEECIEKKKSCIVVFFLVDQKEMLKGKVKKVN